MRSKKIAMALVCLVLAVLVFAVKGPNQSQAAQIKAEKTGSTSGLESLPELCDFEMSRITSGRSKISDTV